MKGFLAQVQPSESGRRTTADKAADYSKLAGQKLRQNLIGISRSQAHWLSKTAVRASVRLALLQPRASARQLILNTAAVYL
jgi:hypothetical protein